MDTLINIIHPNTFRLYYKVKAFVMGPIDEFRDRDQELSNFILEALEKGARVLHHRSAQPDSLAGIIHDLSFEEDPYLSCLLDERIQVVLTTTFGLPIRNERPPEVPQQEWEVARNTYSNDAVMAQKVGRPDLAIFVGGWFENCMSNAVNYHLEHYSGGGASVRYVPSLCVSFDKGRREAVQQRFEKQGVLPITSDQALSLMGNGHANL